MRAIFSWAPVLAAGVACAAPVAAAAATNVVVYHDTYTTTEVAPSDGDGIVGPGDTFTLHESLHSVSTDANGAVTLTGVQTTLSTQSSSLASILTPGAGFPDLTFGTVTANNLPDYKLAVASGAECGVSIPVGLSLTATQGGPVNVIGLPAVTTGAAGPVTAYDSSQTGMNIGPSQGAFIASVLNIPTAGRVKSVRVRIGSLSEPIPKDLTISLTSPAGTTVNLIQANLANNYGGGQNFTNTIFDSSAATSIYNATAPFTGTFKPDGDLGSFVGQQQQGTWTLNVTQTFSGQTGTLNAWGQDTSRAICSPGPVAAIKASPSPQTPGANVTLDGSGSADPGATITDYAWNFGDGSPVLHTTTATTTHAYAARGSYPASLQITDSNAKTAAATTSVSITAPPVAALAVNPSSPVAASPVTFDASASTHDPLGTIVKYEWDLDGSGRFATVSSPASNPQITTTYPHAQSVLVGVRVTDDAGATATRTIAVTVSDAPPIATFTAPASATVGQQVSLNASASYDPDGTITRYAWDLTGAGSYSTDGGLSPTLGTSFATPGLVTVGLRVTDDAGKTATVTRQVQVNPRPATAVLTATPSSATAGAPVAFDAHGSASPDGTIVAYAWDLDGSGRFATAGAVTLVNSFAFAGTYQVRVRVTDNFGQTATSPPVLVTITAALVVAPPGGSTPTLPAGDARAGIASLSPADATVIVIGSSSYFATVTGTPVRRATEVARHGLWINLLSDRPATFTLSLSLSRADAVALRLAPRLASRRGRRAPAGRVTVGRASVALTAGGQRPFDLEVDRRLAEALAKAKVTVTVLAQGDATDGAGHVAMLARAFTLRR